MSPAWTYDWATVCVLWRRDLLRFVRQPLRVLAALGQPLIFWWILGSGMARSFRLPGSPVDALEYFYPGVVLMVALFAALITSIGLIEDRHQGFLQVVLAGPGSNLAVVCGKCLGATTVALAQTALFLALAPWAGFPYGEVHWPMLLAALLTAALLLSAVGFALAWVLDSVQAYQAVQMTLILPLWLLSGALFPLRAGGHGLEAVMRLNPLAYAVAGVRQALYGGHAPEALAPAALTAPWPLVVGGAALLGLGLALAACRR